ncbi:hypothetical protein ABZX85_40235 [Streptomyces sp. NPDC004539]|uniref:SCO2400 family protein n=1 Tax=Streptomyces sp. NPDC004539 TaxID=3154280 RepID=UPI0033A8F93B
MDYCSTCRRHLNGALVCPGCGAYAPDIAPLPGGAPAPIVASTAAPVHEVFPDVTARPDEPDSAEYDATAVTPAGRAARRRQRERWRKTQRRALVATAVALVGGGLTVASMNRQSTDRTQAASAPDREPMGVAEEEVDQPTTPVSTPSDAHRDAAGTRTPSRSSAARPEVVPDSGSPAPTPNSPRAQAAAPAQVTPPTQQPAQQDTPTPTPSQDTSTTPGSAGGTATEPTPAPSPSTSDDTSAGSGTSSDATDPAGLCLLGLVCIT